MSPAARDQIAQIDATMRSLPAETAEAYAAALQAGLAARAQALRAAADAHDDKGQADRARACAAALDVAAGFAADLYTQLFVPVGVR